MSRLSTGALCRTTGAQRSSLEPGTRGGDGRKLRSRPSARSWSARPRTSRSPTVTIPPAASGASDVATLRIWARPGTSNPGASNIFGVARRPRSLRGPPVGRARRAGRPPRAARGSLGGSPPVTRERTKTTLMRRVERLEKKAGLRAPCATCGGWHDVILSRYQDGPPDRGDRRAGVGSVARAWRRLPHLRPDAAGPRNRPRVGPRMTSLAGTRRGKSAPSLAFSPCRRLGASVGWSPAAPAMNCRGPARDARLAREPARAAARSLEQAKCRSSSNPRVGGSNPPRRASSRAAAAG